MRFFPFFRSRSWSRSSSVPGTWPSSNSRSWSSSISRTWPSSIPRSWPLPILWPRSTSIAGSRSFPIPWSWPLWSILWPSSRFWPRPRLGSTPPSFFGLYCFFFIWSSTIVFWFYFFRIWIVLIVISVNSTFKNSIHSWHELIRYCRLLCHWLSIWRIIIITFFLFVFIMFFMLFLFPFLVEILQCLFIRKRFILQLNWVFIARWTFIRWRPRFTSCFWNFILLLIFFCLFQIFIGHYCYK